MTMPVEMEIISKHSTNNFGKFHKSLKAKVLQRYCCCFLPLVSKRIEIPFGRKSYNQESMPSTHISRKAAAIVCGMKEKKRLTNMQRVLLSAIVRINFFFQGLQQDYNCATCLNGDIGLYFILFNSEEEGSFLSSNE